MKRTGLWIGTAIAAFGAVIGGLSVLSGAEPPVAAAAPRPMSLWNFLGIPQGSDRLRDASANRLGNNPNAERKPPLKRIADPENLKFEPGNEDEEKGPIKTAAEVKGEADLAPQKIKALKYLATVCCGCSKYKKEVKDAFMEALRDCTEEVRYEAAVALCQCAGNPCKTCNGGTCCDPDIMARLHEMAEGKDPTGCDAEASPRVRAAAGNALRSCKDNFRPTQVRPVPEGQEGPIEGQPRPGETTSFPRGAGRIYLTGDPRIDAQRLAAGGQVAQDGAEGVRWQGEWLYVEETVPPSINEGRLQPTSFAEPSMQPTLEDVPYSPLAMSTPDRFDTMSSSIWANEDRIRPPLGEGTTKEQIKTNAPSDSGDALANADSVQTVEVQRRSPLSLDPHIRGYKWGQIYSQADGAFWTPARIDMDTMISKIDPGLIEDIAVIPGPYGLRYGPGFAFIDVTRTPTPRCAPNQFETTLESRTNGGQVYGRETASGGGENWGYRFSYGARKGSDYRAGNDLLIPSSYESQDLLTEFGYDINPNQRLAFTFLKYDQANTEYPDQFFDIGHLGTYGFESRLVDDDPSNPWTKMTVGGWYNRTGFRGFTPHRNRPDFIEIGRAEGSLESQFPTAGTIGLNATTNGAVSSAGTRAMATFGERDESHINVGTDFRYLQQNIVENFNVNAANPSFTFPPPGDTFETNQPHSWLIDPGVFAEWSHPLTESWTVETGVRGDWVGSRASATDLLSKGFTNIIDIRDLDQLSQNDPLYAFYLMNSWKMDEHWTLKGGFGQAQRAPTLTERYADGLFLSIAQTGFNHVYGDPTLSPERNWQIDLGVSADYDRFRAKANVFQSWVINYITYADDTVNVPPGTDPFFSARVLRFVNTPLATLTGFEWGAEYDLFPRLTPFARMSYVTGRDQTIDRPLCSIPPLDTNLGFRFHDPDRGRRWGVEFGPRIVNTQDELGTIRGALNTPLEERTGGFTVWNLRSYWNVKKNLSLVGGIENIFDKTYQQHLDLRLIGPEGYATARVLEPGITPYAGINWVF